jgi:serine/threonine protein phosphatase PrpC
VGGGCRVTFRAGSHLGRTTDHINRNILFTCLGSPAKPVFDLSGPVQLMQGDRVLLCSDGLWGALSDQVITEVLAHNPISDAVPELVERALREAGAKSDNVTVIAVEWEASENDDEDTLAGIETAALGDDMFESTIQAGHGPNGSCAVMHHDVLPLTSLNGSPVQLFLQCRTDLRIIPHDRHTQALSNLDLRLGG